jgi:hypothetical protein
MKKPSGRNTLLGLFVLASGCGAELPEASKLATPVSRALTVVEQMKYVAPSPFISAPTYSPHAGGELVFSVTGPSGSSASKGSTLNAIVYLGLDGKELTRSRSIRRLRSRASTVRTCSRCPTDVWP